ncbi:MAG: hypothetical protein U0793_04770 [Gemmataceae bacterium]
MMLATTFLVSAFWLSGEAPPASVDLAKIDRSIRKEPAYAGKPKYCLFVFGPEAATRVWVVLDGAHVYVDRNGDGDLTDPGEKLSRGSGPGFMIGDIRERDGKTLHRSWSINLSGDAFRSTVITARLGRQLVAPQEQEKPRFADRPEEAPIIHFDGPLALAQYSEARLLPRGATREEDDDQALRILIGTPGLGKAAFAACPWNCVSKRGPIAAEFDYACSFGGRLTHATTLKTFS